MHACEARGESAIETGMTIVSIAQHAA